METLQQIAAKHPFIQNLPPAAVERILSRAIVREFKPGDILIREGDYADKCFLIDHGKIAVECHTPQKDLRVETVGDGGVIGWSWLFPPFSWHFQCQAVEPTVALQLSAARILIACEEDPVFGHLLMKRITQMLIHRLQETRRCLIEASQEVETAELAH